MRVVPTPTSPVLINPNLLGHRNNCKQCSIKTLKSQSYTCSNDNGIGYWDNHTDRFLEY